MRKKLYNTSLSKNQKQEISFKPVDQTGTLVDLSSWNVEFKIRASQPQIASFKVVNDHEFEINPQRIGTTLVTAGYGDFKFRFRVTVIPAPRIRRLK